MATYKQALLYLPGPTYASRVASVVSNFEKLYKTFIWLLAEPTDRPYSDRHLTVLFEDLKYFLGPDTSPEHLLRGLDTMGGDDNAQLLLISVRQVSSGEISFEGLGDAIDASAEVIDPLRRRERRERLRHLQETNRVEEQVKQADLQLKNLELAKAQMGVLNDMVNLGVLTREAANLAIRNLFKVQDHVTNVLDADGIRAIGTAECPPTDPHE